MAWQRTGVLVGTRIWQDMGLTRHGLVWILTSLKLAGSISERIPARPSEPALSTRQEPDTWMEYGNAVYHDVAHSFCPRYQLAACSNTSLLGIPTSKWPQLCQCLAGKDKCDHTLIAAFILLPLLLLQLLILSDQGRRHMQYYCWVLPPPPLPPLPPITAAVAAAAIILPTAR